MAEDSSSGVGEGSQIGELTSDLAIELSGNVPRELTSELTVIFSGFSKEISIGRPCSMV